LTERAALYGETRKLVAILVSDVVGYSRLAGADEDRILARLRTLRSDLIDPALGTCKARAERTIREADVMLSAGKDVSPVPIVRRCGVPRRFG
jgi:class 3 adenylate cyclase